jgi:hypothetical protein
MTQVQTRNAQTDTQKPKKHIQSVHAVPYSPPLVAKGLTGHCSGAMPAPLSINMLLLFRLRDNVIGDLALARKKLYWLLLLVRVCCDVMSD